MAVKITFDDADAAKALRQVEKRANKKMNQLMGDLKDRAPGWIASGIIKDYNLKKTDVERKSTLRIKGGGLGDLEFTYTGRLLTPASFGMTPKSPPKEKGYTIRATIKKGKRSTIGVVKKPTKKQRMLFGKNFTRSGPLTSLSSPPMLQSTGSERVDATTHIPFQRVMPGHSPMSKVIKTISVPQMIKDGKGNLKPGVAKKFNEGVEKRFYHYTDRMFW